MKGHGQGAVLKAEEKMCPMCKREHGVYTVQMEQTDVYCGEEVCYRAKFEYCENEDAYFAVQELKEENRRKKREAYLSKRKSTL